jgi:hypothetical protein
MLQINKSQQACAYGWLREVHNMKTTFTNAPCYKSLSADHMIKTVEKHQALSILKKKNIIASKQKTLVHTAKTYNPMDRV